MAEVSIGVPVHNGGDLIGESLACLRAQSFDDLEIIVADNASTDGTRTTIDGLAKDDPRIRTIFHPDNIGGVANFMATLEAASSPYFMWRAHDDLSDANYVEALHGLLDRDADALLAVGNVRSTDLDGGRERMRTFRVPTGPLGAQRLRLMFTGHASWVYGLWRTAYLRETFARVTRAYPHAWAQDHLLLLGVFLRAGVRGTPTTTFHQRIKRRPGDARRREEMSPGDRIWLRREFSAACQQELAQLGSLGAIDRAILRAVLPAYADRRCQRATKIAGAYLKRLLGR